MKLAILVDIDRKDIEKYMDGLTLLNEKNNALFIYHLISSYPIRLVKTIDDKGAIGIRDLSKEWG